MPAPNPQRQRDARRAIEARFLTPESVWVIHYACQRLDQDEAAGSPRVTTFAARNLGTDETVSASIHREAEIAGLGPVQILANLDQLERSLIAKILQFIGFNRTMHFVHWNMRDAVFGFQAIEHRARLHGLDPFVLPEERKLDLARALTDIYGTGYVDGAPLEALARTNGMPIDGFLPGREEAEAFDRGRYRAVQRSTLTKVTVLYEILRRVHDRTLKTKANWWTLNVGRVREATEMFERNPVQAIAGLLFAGISAGFAIFSRIF